MIKDLMKPLDDSEIELRIGSASALKGFSILAYKTARADVKRLNDVCGLLWKNRYFYDDKELLCCEISVYDNETKQWISRSDVGTESQTEKEKGSYSDAMKRAGFKFGIGAELYEFPFIWVKWDKWHKNTRGKDVPTVNLSGWQVKYMTDETYKAMIVYDGYGKIMWSNHGDKKPTVPDIEPLDVLKKKVKKAFKMLNYSESNENLMIEEYLGDKPIAEDYEMLLKKLRNEYKQMEK